MIGQCNEKKKVVYTGETENTPVFSFSSYELTIVASKDGYENFNTEIIFYFHWLMSCTLRHVVSAVFDDIVVEKAFAF